MTGNSFQAFRESLRGDLIQPDDQRYDSARKLYNGMIERRPLAIARCVDVADVLTAVHFAREHDLLLAVRSGGHNGGGLGSCDDGLVIDLSRMKGVRVDPERRTVRVEGPYVQGAMLITPRTLSGWRRPVVCFQRLALVDSRWAEG